jgi:hypothetical protein
MPMLVSVQQIINALGELSDEELQEVREEIDDLLDEDETLDGLETEDELEDEDEDEDELT